MTIRMLLADDHQMLREGLRSLLEKHEDFVVVAEVSNGRDAVARARELRPNVVVMDIGMKELNGIDATRQIRSEAPGVEVVVLSTHANETYVLGALEAGAAAYVLKISAHTELVDAVRAVTRGLRYLSPDVTGIVVDAGLQSGARESEMVQSRLTAREREVLQLVAEGRTSSEIAALLHLSTRTVEQHRRRIMVRLDLHSVAELTRYAVREGIVLIDS